MDAHHAANKPSEAYAMLQTKRSQSRHVQLHEFSQKGAMPDIGSTASFDEDGYQSVASTCCEASMETYIRRLIHHEGYELCNEWGLHGFVPWFTCSKHSQANVLLQTKGVQSFEALRSNLQSCAPQQNVHSSRSLVLAQIHMQDVVGNLTRVHTVGVRVLPVTLHRQITMAMG